MKTFVEKKSILQLLSCLICSVLMFCFSACENQFFRDAAGIYEVSFESNGGTSIETVNTNKIKTCPNPEKKDAEFLGWYESSNLSGNAVEFPYEPKKDVVLYAKWNQKYTIHFETNGGTVLQDVLCSELKTILTPKKEDCTFAGWFLYADFSGEEIDLPFVPVEETVLYAKWLKNYTVTFETNGGSEVDSIKTGLLTELPSSNKENYEFSGWFEKSSLSGEEVKVPYTILKDTTLYAKWIPNYLVEFETNGGSEISSFRARSVENVQTPEKSGFSFIAWYLDSDFKTLADFPLTLTKDIKLYALFKENFTATFETNGGTAVSSVYSYVIEKEPCSTLKNKSLGGWYLDSDFNEESKVTFPYTLTSDITLYAKWIAEQCTITYYANGATSGEVPMSVSVDKGASYTVSGNTGNLEKNGYAFTKWNTKADGNGQGYSAGATLTVTGDVALYAQWGKDYAAMVYIEGGYYYFGDPETSDRPKITLSSFQIAQYELIYELWLEVYTWAKDNGYNLTAASKGYDTNDQFKSFVPATNISWNMACVWCNAYSAYKNLEPVYYRGSAVWKDDSSTSGTFSWDKTKNGYRLPTECEWEFAAGGGNATTHDQYTYAGSNTIDDVAWYSSNSGKEAQPVGTKKANTLGIYDMSGNVAEWCYDYCASFGTGELANPVHESGTYFRIVRGGELYSSSDVSAKKITERRSGYYTTRGTYYTYGGGVGYTGSLGIRIARNAE